MTQPADVSPLTTPLLGSRKPLAETYDVALLDLDGVCFAGDARIEHAAEGVNGARALGMSLSFVTNNASRAPQAVVDKLARNDIEGHPSEVFSAAMDGAAILAERVPAGSPVYVIGGAGLREAVTDAGLTVVDSAEDHPAAVIQGWDPSVDWAMMSEGVYAINDGAIFVATNTDATLPTERGFALGNGSLVVAVAHASGVEPIAGGKPFPGIYQRALARSGGTNPLAVGDRLNTDQVGARAAGIPGLHVLTGVSTARDVLTAPVEDRPSYLHTDLRGLVEAHPEPERVLCDQAIWWRVGRTRVRVDAGLLDWHGHGVLAQTPTEEPVTVSLDAYRGLACAVWEYADAHDGDTSRLTIPPIRVVAD